METSLFDYPLDPKRIAQAPVSPRDQSKLLVCASRGRLGEFTQPFRFEHRRFGDLVSELGPNDLVVLNDAKVLPVRLLGRRDGGTGEVEALLLERLGEREWKALLHLSAKARPGLRMIFEPGLVAECLSTHEERVASNGEVRLKFSGLALERIALETWLERHGHVPLPPYIEREDQPGDKKTYQTVYASKSGSAAAPTAGFHFTEELLARLRAKGVEFGQVTLHVGIGTFRPIKTEQIEEHPMHEERFEISPEFLAQFESARKAGKRVIAVGTTVVRALESWVADQSTRGGLVSGSFSTRAYIKPESSNPFRAVDGLITNFHLPRSSLLVLVAAAMGLEPMRQAYGEALRGDYRFFSYGDAMFIRGDRE